MLSKEDQDYIFSNGWMVDHDWELFSRLLGNPYLINGLLCYYDGIRVSICGWPINREIITEAELIRAVNFAVNFFVEVNLPAFITLWGPTIISLPQKVNKLYKKSSIRLKDNNNVHLQIQLSNYTAPQNKRFYKQANKVAARGTTCEIQQGGIFTELHAKIMNEFLVRENLPLWDERYISCVSHLSSSPKTRQFNAFQDGELLGFIMTREVFIDGAIMAWSFFDKSKYRISDYLYLKTIEYYLNSEFNILDMGYTVNEDLLCYKKKWGANIDNGAYFICSFEKI